LIERLGLEPARVRAIHLGIDHERFRPGEEEREDFLLYPALGWPHKNHARLFEAFALLRARRSGLRLVLTGYAGSVPDGAEARGRVPADELLSLYRRAAALVFPSLYEGFGQPPLEAMACGCPVACSNAASLPEVVGDAARLFDPDSVEDMAAAVEEVLDHPDEWRRRGLERATLFSWDACARAHEEVYRELRSS
jgi:glycosyltransferase involved in cell wall biosynthesis